MYMSYQIDRIVMMHVSLKFLDVEQAYFVKINTNGLYFAFVFLFNLCDLENNKTRVL